MAKTNSKDDRHRRLSEGFDGARSLLINLGRPTQLLLDAARQSEQFGARLKTKTGRPRGASKTETEWAEGHIRLQRRMVLHDFVRLAGEISSFETMYEVIAEDVSALYPVNADSVRLWDIRGVSAMDVLLRGAWEVMLRLVGHDRSAIKLAASEPLVTEDLRANLEPRLFPFWPGHYYLPWATRDASELAELDVRLRREQIKLLRTDPGAIEETLEDDDELPAVSKMGAPLKPTFPMSPTQRAKNLGLKPRAFRAGMRDNLCRFQRYSPRVFTFCDTETRPAKRLPAKSRPARKRPRR